MTSAASLSFMMTVGMCKSTECLADGRMGKERVLEPRARNELVERRMPAFSLCRVAGDDDQPLFDPRSTAHAQGSQPPLGSFNHQLVKRPDLIRQRSAGLGVISRGACLGLGSSEIELNAILPQHCPCSVEGMSDLRCPATGEVSDEKERLLTSEVCLASNALHSYRS